MRTLLKAGFILIAYAITSIGTAAAQAPNPGCSIESATLVAQTLRCEGGVTIVVENGARYSLLAHAHRGRVDGVELNSKAVLIDVPARSSGIRFQVITPQAIAAVRGTRWAVDAAESKTSVFVAAGRVAVGRRTGGHSVTLGAGEGVDVEEGAPLIVKRWSQTRVSALMARLGQ
jgi:ferric-dicitrate binding protein FerR (iron transport regulator)